MRIAVVTARYSLTGVPLAQLRLARAFAARGHDVDVIFGDVAAGQAPPDPSGLNLVIFNARRARDMVRPMVRYFRQERPDVVFCAEDNLIGFMLLAAIASRTRAKISGSSRVPPSWTYSAKPFSKGWAFRQLMRAVMWRADALTCVSQDMVEEYRTMFGPATPHVAVYNIVGDEHSRERMREPVDHPWYVDPAGPLIIAAGTLSPRKGFADLIRAMALLRERGVAGRLVIFGEGRSRPELEALVAELELADRVSLPGRIDNTLRYFARSDVSVLSSYAEGLPNVLIESMMCGCSPVATDCPTGPREVLAGDRYGRLIPMHDPVAMADAMAALLAEPVPAERLEEGVAPFGEAAVVARHFAVLGIDPDRQEAA